MNGPFNWSFPENYVTIQPRSLSGAFYYQSQLSIRHQCATINLETAVEHGKDMQEIGMHREIEKFVVTLLVIRAFSSFLAACRTIRAEAKIWVFETRF